MVDKVLQLSSLETYEFELKFQPLEIKEEIAGVLNSLKGRMDKFGIDLRTELQNSYIKGDKDSLTIVLINILDNAIKYNKENGSIFVKSYIHSNEVCIEISDTGIGIPKEHVRRVFDPFYTVDKNRSREKGGAGLGLSLVKKHAELMNGSIALLNTGDNGTTFRITFPLFTF